MCFITCNMSLVLEINYLILSYLIILFINVYIITLVLCKTILHTCKGNNLSFEKLEQYGRKGRKVIILTIFTPLKLMSVIVCHQHGPKASHSMVIQMNNKSLINISW